VEEWVFAALRSGVELRYGVAEFRCVDAQLAGKLLN
jgi:hypothetical protein